MKPLDRSDFGPNVWLIDEIYRRYLASPASVSEVWRDFFEGYRPRGANGSASSNGSAASGSTAEETTTDGGAANGQGPAAAPSPAGVPAPQSDVAERGPQTDGPEGATSMTGAAAAIARHMETSLTVPTATSVRTVPAKLLEVNRDVLNRYLASQSGGKVSFTHLIAWAVVRALAVSPAMSRAYAEVNGRPGVIQREHLNLGLAVDLKREDGSRTLVVPNIRNADTLDFAAFLAAYESLIHRVNENRLAPDDMTGTTVTITNPGMIGTVQSVPRLMSGQSAIVGVGAIAYPAEYSGADPSTLAEIGVSKVVTLTNTYDHRVIQGAESGEFLRAVQELLLGSEGFYDEVFRSLRVPYQPVRWRTDVNPARDTTRATEKEARALQLINQYRVRGHLIADLDPLGAKEPNMHPELDPGTYGFSIWDLDREFVTGGLAGKRRLRLSEILNVLRDAYCGTASVEYMHISEPQEKRWIQDRVEGVSQTLSDEDRRRILTKLNEAEAFERFLHKKYVGHRRYSLEGAESLIPILDAILNDAADADMTDVVIGMSHRGRLNVLANTIGKSYRQIFREFEGDLDPTQVQGSGDVKYHIGAKGKHVAPDGKDISVSVASNPSHLESVDPVVEGMVRAKQDLLDRGSEAPVLPLLIHGEAAFAGQGIVAETLNMSQLSGYRTGGTVHVIINNQLGFTTVPSAGRSSTYASDVAKMVQAPIFHVNGDDPEACVRVARLALQFREAFKKDVVIDMWCYRRWGHNEGDEPAFTQPLMYASIEQLRSVRKRYTEKLVNRGDLSVEEAERWLESFSERLRQAFEETRNAPERVNPVEQQEPAAVGPAEPRSYGVARAELQTVLDAVTTVPDGFHLHPKLARWLDERRGALELDEIDWSLAETLAFGSLLKELVPIRLSGQDSRRGTFSQRHAVLMDQETGTEYLPLAHVADPQGKAFVYDSLLSELAALAFEYGYSVADRNTLVMWEAQFGDFINGAQVIVDQYIVAAEDKWGQRSGLVLLLPHGFEGQGPEHSSARIERFLDLCAEDNIEVVVPSTPSQYFSLLRRQALREVRKPLAVMTPKSLLRLPSARSRTQELVEGVFRPVLTTWEPKKERPGGAGTPPARILLSSGKMAYDLERRREEAGVEDVAILRLEQLYPFPVEALREALAPFGDAPVVWVQEEPENMGAKRFVIRHLRRELGIEADAIARPESASPATGSMKVHQQEQERLLEAALRPS
ncbi:MAG: multifunctional oxoglutarate decarboxylase/oxoglutarate dehydrogenase thiamine pyrophosphate-binding subunit/dihydrolipoyllysine-residue succinyltransferase subunit [Actinomycetota bacterium]